MGTRCICKRERAGKRAGNRQEGRIDGRTDRHNATCTTVGHMISRICVYVSDEEEGKGDEGGGRCACVYYMKQGEREQEGEEGD